MTLETHVRCGSSSTNRDYSTVSVASSSVELDPSSSDPHADPSSRNGAIPASVTISDRIRILPSFLVKLLPTVDVRVDGGKRVLSACKSGGRIRSRRQPSSRRNVRRRATRSRRRWAPCSTELSIRPSKQPRSTPTTCEPVEVTHIHDTTPTGTSAEPVIARTADRSVTSWAPLDNRAQILGDQSHTRAILRPLAFARYSRATATLGPPGGPTDSAYA
jgi:hypothetical protein